MKEYLTIKEFSRFSGIEASTLRFWDEIGLFSPVKRDPNNNYRYYSPEQIILVNFISVMSSLEVPIKKIAEIQGSRTPERIARLIRQKEKELDMEMRKLRECYSIIHTRLETIDFGTKVVNGFNAADMDKSGGNEEDETRIDITKVAVLPRDDTAIILGPRNEWKPREGFYEPFANFCNQAESLRVHLSFPIGAMHDDWEGFMAAPGEPHYFYSMDPTGNERCAAGNYLTGFARGYYGRFGDLHERMAAYAEEHSLRIAGPVYTLFLHDEVCITDPSQYLSQIFVAVSKK